MVKSSQVPLEAFPLQIRLSGSCKWSVFSSFFLKKNNNKSEFMVKFMIRSTHTGKQFSCKKRERGLIFSFKWCYALHRIDG